MEASQAQVTHSRGLIASGSAGPEVFELMAMLGRLGFESELSKGKNPHNVFGPSEQAAVAAFQGQHQIEEDPVTLQASHQGAAGPQTWQAVYDAWADRTEQPRQEAPQEAHD